MSELFSKILSLIISLNLIYSCKTEKDQILLSPSLNESAYSLNIKDSTIVLNSSLIKSFDLDKDGINDLEFYLEDRNNSVLKLIDFRLICHSGTEILGRDTAYFICKDSILFIEYQFYIYRLYNCSNNPERIDSNFCAFVCKEDEINDKLNLGNFSNEAIISYDKEYIPIIFPDITSKDIQKGDLISNSGSLILLKKAEKKYLLKIKWERPFFIIEDLRILAG